MLHRIAKKYPEFDGQWAGIPENHRVPLIALLDTLVHGDVFHQWLATVFPYLGSFFYTQGPNLRFSIWIPGEALSVAHTAEPGDPGVHYDEITIVRGLDGHFRFAEGNDTLQRAGDTSTTRDYVSFFECITAIARKKIGDFELKTLPFIDAFNWYTVTSTACGDLDIEISKIYTDAITRNLQEALNKRTLVVYTTAKAVSDETGAEYEDFAEQAKRLTDAGVPFAYHRSSVPARWTPSSCSEINDFIVRATPAQISVVGAQLNYANQTALLFYPQGCAFPTDDIPGRVVDFTGDLTYFLDLIERVQTPVDDMSDAA